MKKIWPDRVGYWHRALMPEMGLAVNNAVYEREGRAPVLVVAQGHALEARTLNDQPLALHSAAKLSFTERLSELLAKVEDLS
jgi:hypothetical protein